jgi:hypothetical protein
MEIPAPKKRFFLEFYIDVSGSPYYNVYFGLVSVNPFTKDDIFDDFFSSYPQYKNIKGRKLKKEDFLTTIDFFNQRKVKMFVFPVTANDWRYYKSLYGKHREFLQKISGIFYFHLLSNVAWNDNKYRAISCVESQLGKIDRVFHHCMRIATMKNITFDFLHGRDFFNRDVKIADFIAYSGRTLKPNDVLTFTNYKIIKNKPPKWYFNVIFT